MYAGVAPRASQRKRDGDSDSAPDVAAQLTSPTGSGQALIALSANPGPPAPVAPPAGNLAARVSISPEGKRSDPSGAPPGARSSGGGNAANSGGGGTNSTGASISGGAPRSANIDRKSVVEGRRVLFRSPVRRPAGREVERRWKRRKFRWRGYKFHRRKYFGRSATEREYYFWNWRGENCDAVFAAALYARGGGSRR